MATPTIAATAVAGLAVAITIVQIEAALLTLPDYLTDCCDDCAVEALAVAHHLVGKLPGLYATYRTLLLPARTKVS